MNGLRKKKMMPVILLVLFILCALAVFYGPERPPATSLRSKYLSTFPLAGLATMILRN
jgi:hypothetical protein